jgi:hypothetical protein
MESETWFEEGSQISSFPEPSWLSISFSLPIKIEISFSLSFWQPSWPKLVHQVLGW